jgi:tetratricopeptide (TPR) repeat protein
VAFQHHAGPLAELDERFAEFAKRRAGQLAPDADWQAPELPPEADLAAVRQWNEQHPNDIPGLQLLASRLMDQKRWPEAKETLEKLLALYPENLGEGSPYLPLARVYRELGETDAERSVLEKLAAIDADALEVNLRLIDLYLADAQRRAAVGGAAAPEREDPAPSASEVLEEWECVARAADRALAIHPLIPAPYRSRARAAEALSDPAMGIQSYRALLRMGPADPAEAHFRLARLLYRQGDVNSARRQVLKALEEAPRYRAAHRLLLELVDRPQREVVTP